MDVNFRINRSGHEEKIYEDLLSLSYSSESLSDLVFVCHEGARRYAHQSILTRLSPFIAKIQNPGDRIWITLEDTDVHILDVLLRFLYTGEVTVSDALKVRLLNNLCKALEISLENSVKTPTNSSPLYCLCRQPEKGKMIGCDFCDEWYHPKCINVGRSEVDVLKGQFWKCPRCANSKQHPKSPKRIIYDSSSTGTSDREFKARKINPPKSIVIDSYSSDGSSSPKPLSKKRKRRKHLRSKEGNFSSSHQPSISHETSISHQPSISHEPSISHQPISSHQTLKPLFNNEELSSEFLLTAVNSKGIESLGETLVLKSQPTPEEDLPGKSDQNESCFHKAVENKKPPTVVYSQPLSLIKDIMGSPNFNVRLTSDAERPPKSNSLKAKEPAENEGINNASPIIEEPTTKESPAEPKHKEEEDPSEDDLSYCYSCLSIFVSKKALQDHQLEHHC